MVQKTNIIQNRVICFNDKSARCCCACVLIKEKRDGKRKVPSLCVSPHKQTYLTYSGATRHLLNAHSDQESEHKHANFLGMLINT